MKGLGLDGFCIARWREVGTGIGEECLGGEAASRETVGPQVLRLPSHVLVPAFSDRNGRAAPWRQTRVM